MQRPMKETPSCPAPLVPSFCLHCARVTRDFRLVLAAGHQLSVGSADSSEHQLLERSISTKFGGSFFHLSCAWNNSVINLSLIWGVLFFIGLLRDFMLYAIGLWNIILNYNSCSEPVLKKLLAKIIWVSECNFATKHRCLVFLVPCLPEVIFHILAAHTIVWGPAA